MQKDHKVNDVHRFYVEEQLSPHMYETPEGFLVCADVPITRIGEFTYKSNEVPVKGGTDGVVKIIRDEDEVFAEKTIRSFEGKPITINHPDDFVTPENWKELAHGHLGNVRRGEGEQQDLLIGDICLTTEEAIKLVKAGLREVSCGYDAQYEELKPGLGKQKEIIGNHIALVSKGRAGSRCAIMDQDPNCEIENKKISEEDKNVSKSKTVKDVFRRMFPKLNLDSIKDEDLEFGESNEADGGAEAAQVAAEEAKQAAIKAVEAAKEAVAAAQNIEGEKKEEQNLEQDQNDDPLAALSAKVDEISAKLDTLIEALSDEENQEEENQEEENQDEDLNEEENLNQDGEENENVLNAKVGDALWQDTISRAETIVPGIVAAKPKASDMKKAIIAVKRKALSDGMTKDHQAIIKPLLGGKKISALSLDALDTAFIAASEMIGKVNNSRVQKKTFQMKDLSSHSELSAINARNREFWKNKK